MGFQQIHELKVQLQSIWSSRFVIVFFCLATKIKRKECHIESFTFFAAVAELAHRGGPTSLDRVAAKLSYN